MARIDPRRAKLHRSYSVAEVAELFSAHRQTVRNWIDKGLPAFRVRGTVLILGSELRAWLTARRHTRRVVCPPGAMYCMKCRDARHPPRELVEAAPLAAGTLNLRGLCPECGSLMHRRVNALRLAAAGFEGVPPQGGAPAPRR